MKARIQLLSILSSALLFLIGGEVLAVPTQVRHLDEQNHCDPLLIPLDVDEIGSVIVPFPSDELLDHGTIGMTNPVCLPTDNSMIPDIEVAIFNLTGRDLQEVWYVADPETDITNYDGFSNDAAFPGTGHEAFRIDNAASDPGGAHHPLISESILADGIWQAGEEWRFVLQDYSNSLGLPADAFTSIGVGDASMPLTGVIDSSGSIIAIPTIPEPSSIVIAALAISAGAWFGVRHRSNRLA